MNFTTYIARRYFFSGKSSNAVNIISAVSMLGILVGTAALIIVLSAFNGLEGLVKGFYQTFDPDIKATLISDKYRTSNPETVNRLRSISGVQEVSEVLEERVLFTFRNKEYIATLKGIDPEFSEVTHIKSAIVSGKYELSRRGAPAAVMGLGVAYYLGYSRADFDSPVSVFAPAEKSGMDFSSAFVSEMLYPSGIFSIQPDFDEKYVLASLGFVRELLNRPEAVNRYEISLAPGADTEAVKGAVAGILGTAFKVQNRNEQQEVFFKVMKSENLFTFLVFVLILTISTFTIMGSITMLILDKKSNIYTLWAMGADVSSLRRIFFKEGVLVSMTGAVTGVVIGVAVIWLQENYGLLSLGQGYAIESYPVELDPRDLLLVLFTVAAISTFTSWITSRRLDLKLIRKEMA